MDVFKNFFKKDILSVIFIQAGISELKTIFSFISYVFPGQLYKKKHFNKKISIKIYYKFVIYLIMKISKYFYLIKLDFIYFQLFFQ